MELLRRILRKAVKVIAIIAAVVFFFANPLSKHDREVIAFFISLPVFILCALLLYLLNGNRDGGYWPKPPNQ